MRAAVARPGAHPVGGIFFRPNQSSSRRPRLTAAVGNFGTDAIPSASTPSPRDPAAAVWFSLTVAAAAATAVLTPLHVAFDNPAAFYAGDGAAAAQAALTVVWAVDAGMAWRARCADAAAPLSGGALASPTAADASTLALDVVSIVSLHVTAIELAGGVQAVGDDALPYYFLLRLTTLLRLHRVRSAFQALEYDTRFNLLAVTIARNAALVAFAAHTAACAFYFAASVGVGFDPALLPGVDADLLASADGDGARYLLCLFWALTTLTSSEYGNPVPSTLGETAAATSRAAINVLFQIVLFSYILGSTSMLLVQGDERTSRFRERSAKLKDFSTRAGVPPDLAASMDDHLRLHFATDEASDDAVLQIYPTALRRRVLRHLYGATLRDVFLFRGTSRRFRDAVLAEARLELFLPGIDVLAAGDAVNEIYLVVAGTVALKGGPGGAGTATLSSSAGSLDGGEPPAPADTLTQGALFGELAFFTEEPQAVTITSATTVRVLTITRGALDSTLRAFPGDARTVLANLAREAERLVAREFPAVAPTSLTRELRPTASMVRETSAAAAAAASDADLAAAAGVGAVVGAGAPPLSAPQRAALADLVRVRAAVTALAAAAEQERTTRFLYAASRGDLRALRALLGEGVSANAADYDARTAIMLAAASGHAAAVDLLLAAGADPRAGDALGGCALAEACARGDEGIIRALVAAGATLANSRTRGGGDVATAARLCAAVHAHDAPLLRRLCEAGANLNAGDWDGRAALHIAASDGSATLVALLVDAGADVAVVDRWGSTPLDEAVRVGAGPVVAYLEAAGAPRGARVGGEAVAPVSMKE